ncbi:hypothetical protein [Engelhardtia mirabilis]|uniref:Uncharacterized protein n=1 Tax=Engelhardtia mirabilis TaxID=2528011 RepID=A0A518BGI6_9BACT|nr:hypothetical protein Pla133_11650 [Planctomycetes bacterium Pla133]QDV00426.1 hypothetical protein Pla86_11650 [Planctomycetes bacterium Pla86]
MRRTAGLLTGADGGPRPIQVAALSEQFFCTLRASFKRLPEPAEQDAVRRRLWLDVEQLLHEAADSGASWDHAYQVEQYLVDLYDPMTLGTELRVRLLEADSTLSPELSAWYQAEVVTAGTDAAAQRAVLSRLVNDLQWRYKMRETRRGFTQRITRNTAFLFVASIALFVAVLGLSMEWDRLAGSWLDEVVLSIGAGAFGAGFSMMLGLNQRLGDSGLDNLKLLSNRWIMGSRVLVGAGAALILMYLMKSSLLSGSIIPDIDGASDSSIGAMSTGLIGPPPPGEEQGQGAPDSRAPLSSESVALLVAWCFIAGFSEKLVPSILARAESNLKGGEPPGAGQPMVAMVRPVTVPTALDDPSDDGDLDELEDGAEPETTIEPAAATGAPKLPPQ